MYALSFFMLKDMLPSLPVRNMQNEIKTVSVGGTPRVRIPSQALKRPIREEMSEDEVIFANGSDMVHLYLDKYIQDGTFADRENVAYINLATSLCDALNTPYRKYGTTQSDDKGSLVHYDKKTLPAIFEAVMRVYQDNAAEFKKKLSTDIKAKVQKAAKDAYHQYATHPVQALLGKMATGGAADTYYGALRMGDALSVDVHAGDREDFVARMLCHESPSDNGGFFDGVLNIWSAKERAKPNADTMNSFDIAANTFALPAVVDTRLLYKNLCLHNATAVNTEVRSSEIAREMTKDISLEFLRRLIMVQHAGKQSSNMSFTRPSLVVIGVHKSGQPVFPTFPKPLMYNGMQDKSVMEQAIERTIMFLRDETFAFDDVKYYVMLSEEYGEYKEQFEELGATMMKAKTFNSLLAPEVNNMVDCFTTV